MSDEMIKKGLKCFEGNIHVVAYTFIYNPIAMVVLNDKS